MGGTFKIESLLSARLFMSPQLAGERLYFISDLSGRMSLYAMDRGGSVPEPLLPPSIALQNPILMNGYSFYVLPALNKILVMIDRDGDENYQPCFVPLDGGLPEPAFGERFAGQQVNLLHGDRECSLVVLWVDPRTNPNNESYLADLSTGELTSLGASIYGNFTAGYSEDYDRVVLADGYTTADTVLYLWERGAGPRRLLYGKPLDERDPGEQVPLTGFGSCHFTPGEKGLLLYTALFDDRYGLGYLPLDGPAAEVRPVDIMGTVHQGSGELAGLDHLAGNRYLVQYNIDGVSWAYEGLFDEAACRLQIDRVVAGTGPLSNGMLQSLDYDKAGDRYAAAFSTATSPVQIYTIEGDDRRAVQITRERVLGIPQALLSPGEDYNYDSHDGLRISARLYMPAPELGFEGRRPVVFYVHGGPQSQERPDFAWFSMPLIQFLTLNGMAVWVPNVRGSSGYGLDYVKRVEHDWGGLDRLDHVAAFELLRQDPRLDMDRAGVVGRSYGGFMTLTLAGRHPTLWKAACDMFGPYNLITFVERLPEAWKTYFYLSIGHPEKDREQLIAMSPSTYLHQLACPLLVIQGRNDPRVREVESRDVVEDLRKQGKQVDMIVFENEGHDVLKYENKVRCYNEITDFFRRTFQPEVPA